MPKDDHQYLQTPDRQLWNTADQLRSNIDAAVYKHIVLGLIFLHYVSDAFKERQEELLVKFSDPGDNTVWAATRK